MRRPRCDSRDRSAQPRVSSPAAASASIVLRRERDERDTRGGSRSGCSGSRRRREKKTRGVWGRLGSGEVLGGWRICARRDIRWDGKMIERSARLICVGKESKCGRRLTASIVDHARRSVRRLCALMRRGHRSDRSAAASSSTSNSSTSEPRRRARDNRVRRREREPVAPILVLMVEARGRSELDGLVWRWGMDVVPAATARGLGARSGADPARGGTRSGVVGESTEAPGRRRTEEARFTSMYAFWSSSGSAKTDSLKPGRRSDNVHRRRTIILSRAAASSRAWLMIARDSCGAGDPLGRLEREPVGREHAEERAA